MPALFFPNLNSLRLALTSGLVPPELSRSPAAAGFDPAGRLWLEPPELPPQNALAGLARLGVQALGDAGVPTAPVGCWAELLPLQPDTSPQAGPVLFLVPEKRLGPFVARLRRAGCGPVGVGLPEDEPRGIAWVGVTNPPPSVLAEAAEPDPPAEAFREQAPGVWARDGWRHQVPELLAVPPGCVLLLRPPQSVVAVRGQIPRPAPEEFALPRARRGSAGKPPCPPLVPVTLRLAPRRDPGPETLWVIDAAGVPAFWAFCREADEGLLHRLEAAVGGGDETRLVVRSTGERVAEFVPPPATGFTADPRVPGLFVPADRALRPVLRVRELAAALGTGSGRLVWVEPGPGGGVVAHVIQSGAFRPVSEWVEYQTPAVSPLAVEGRSDPFPLPRFVVETEPVPVPEPDPDPLPFAEELETPPPPAEPGWLRRSLRRLAGRLRPARPEEVTPPPAAPKRPRPRAATPAVQRAGRDVGSPETLVHGHDWAARRRELEGRLFRELPQLGPKGRAERWSELAAVYAATGNAADAGVCWMNAVWESSEPPPAWFEHWLGAELRAAKLGDTDGGLDRCLAEPGRPGVGRVVAAYTAAAGFATPAPPEFVPALPRLLAFLDQHFDDVPVRAVWLARLAAARACRGDALGLARWRDRVLARLADRGPGLDLDEPAFLRFFGTASAERFQDARKGLARMWKPAHDWIEKHRKPAGGRLQWAGLDAEINCTVAYARFMFSWGLACLGERTLAKDWAARARRDVSRAGGAFTEPAVHALLGDLFLLRVRDAQEGRAAKPGLPPDLRARLDALPEHRLAQYAVGRLRDHSRVLEPLDRALAFRGLDLKTFWGNDRLGERLFVLFGHADAGSLADEADDLLNLCQDSPAADTVPRVVLTLLERAPRLGPDAVTQLLALLPAALEWTGAWLAARQWPERERAGAALRYQARMLGAGFAAAGLAASASASLSDLIRRLESTGEQFRPALLEVSAQAFRVLRKHGLVGPAETLVRFLEPGEPEEATDPARLGLAAGWYAAGNEDAAIRILDEARDVLFGDAPLKPRARAPLAVAYAEALGFAPPRMAHGRLRELYERLGPVEVDGSTDGYYTLSLLRVIDAGVRAVVTDEFALGPSVRAWLDDDEFLIRGRIHRDMAAVLREEDLG